MTDVVRRLNSYLFAVCFIAFCTSVVQAQTVRTLVSNTGQGTGGGSAEVVAQKFTTGTNATGFTLASIGIWPYQNITNRSGIYVAIKEDNGGQPGSLVANLIDPDSTFPGNAPVAFSAPDKTVLIGNTDYWVVINENQSAKLTPGRTTSDNEDSDSLTDWRIADRSLRIEPEGDGSWINNSDSVLIDVQGYVHGSSAELSISGGSTLEGGDVTFTVSLEFALPDAASVQYSTSISTSDTATSDDFTSASAQTLNIPAGDTTVTFSVETNDDTVTESDETFTVTLSNPSSNASLGTVKSATGTILDNDGKPTVSVAGASVVEGSSVDFTVSLDHATGSDVTVQYSTSIESADTASTDDFTPVDDATLTIASGDTSETINIATTDDDRDEDDETFTLTISSPSSNAELGDPSRATGTIEDDDTVGLSLSKSTLEVVEGDSATYTVALASDPSNTVTVELISVPANVLTFSEDQFTFTTSNWDEPQTVTVSAGHDDDDDVENARIRHRAAGADYASVTKDLTVRVIDDDTIELVIVAPTTPLEVPEDGSASITVALGTEPSDAVTVSVSGTTDTDLTVGTSSFDFTRSNWNSPQTVTVSAAADADTELDVATLTFTATGGDYDNVTANLPVQVPDTVSGQIELSTPSLQVAEHSFQSPPSYQVRLSLQPSNDVEMEVDAVEANHDLRVDTRTTVSAETPAPPRYTTFTRNNWNEWRRIYVFAIRDQDSVHDEVTLRHTTTGGGYGAAVPADVHVLVEDDDQDKGWRVNKTQISMAEGGTTDYRIKLKRRPSANVNVAITGAGDALTVNPSSLTFTRDNWNTNQTVTVTAAAQVSADEANLTLTHTGSGGGYGSSAVDPWELPVTIARDAAAIANGGVRVTSSPLHSRNTYASDEVIVVQVRFDRDVAVDTSNGTPHLKVDVGSTPLNFSYTGMSGTRSLRFEYTVQTGDLDNDGISIGNGAITLNGGTITDTANQRDANLHATRLSTASAHRVDGGQTLAAATLSSLQVLDNGTSLVLTPSFSSTATSYSANIPSATNMVTVLASAAEGGSVNILPADASDTDIDHQVQTNNATTQITVNVTQPPRPAASYTVTLNKVTTTVDISAGTSPIAYHLEDAVAEFTVTLSQTLDVPLDVNLSLTQTQSFLPSNKLSQQIRIGANQSTGTLSFDDSDFSGGATLDGTLTASIASDAAYSIGSNSSAAIDLIVADPVIAVRPPTARLEFLEDAGTVAIGIVAVTVEGVSIPSSLSFFASVETVQGTAVRVNDYKHLSAMSLRFSASDFSAQDGRQLASKSVNVELIDDEDTEGDEYFDLRVVAASLPDGVALTQYDGTLCTSICDYRVDILDDESAPAQVTGVRLTPGGGALLVAWSQVTGADGYKVQWKSGSEDFSDAATTGREALISSGTTTSYTIPSLTDGTTYTVRVIASRGTLDGTASSDVSERPDKPTLSVTDASAKEGTPLSFTVSLSRALSSDVTVEYATSVSATNTAASDDFTAVDDETLTIAAGGSSGSITVQTVDDSNIEEDETFTLTLSNPSDNAALGATFSATGTIENNDADAATVSQIAFSGVPTSGHYRLGDTVELSVTFNEAVDVTGIPRIFLSMDGTPPADSYAIYDAGASSDTVLVFRKVLTATDDDDTDGIDVSANALELDGGTIVVNGTIVAANLDHAALSGGQVRTRVVQDIEVSSQASVGAPAPTGIYGPGETIEFTVTFGESVTVTGTPSLTIVASDSGTQDASYTNGSGGTALVFSWTVPETTYPARRPQISVPANVGSGRWSSVEWR